MADENADPNLDGAPVEPSSNVNSGARLRSEALLQVMRNLLPLPFLIVPFTLIVSTTLHRDVPSRRAVIWVSLSVVAAALGLGAQWGHRRLSNGDRHAVIDSRWFQSVLVTSLAAEGAVFGLSNWVVSRSATEVATIFVLFPAVAAAVAAVVCAARTDLFVVFTAPLFGLSSWGLLMMPDDRFHALVALSVFYALCLLALHRIVSRSLLASLDLQGRSEQLVLLLESERAALAETNEQLTAGNAQLVYLALHDPLTGLFNRRGTLEQIDALLACAQSPFGLLFCDLDRFKAVNDAIGHRGGDQFLMALADRIARTLDRDGIAGRIGGDEFVVVLPGHDLAMAAAVGNRLVGVLSQAVHAEGREIPSSVSIGIATSPNQGTTSSDLLRNANAALYRAKRSGRNRIELFDGEIEHERDAAILAEQNLRRALDHGEILAFFQPEIDASSGRIVGAELLARWLRADGTVVNAAEFIALARRAGLLERLTERVLGQARPYIRRLASLGLPDGFRFRVNLAPASTERAWRDNPLDELVRGIDPRLLTVDVRESAVTTDLPTAAGTLAAFRARGGRVCLDDFGRGVSSLSLLRVLPIDEVRIDHRATDSLAAHPHDRAIVRAIIAVVREIGLSVTAEGVETGAQSDALIALGCVRHQGHLYAPALASDAFETFLVERMAEGYAARDTAAQSWDAIAQAWHDTNPETDSAP